MRVFVTGDHGTDYDLYRHTDADNPPPGTPPSRLCASVGGAGIIYRLLSAAGAELDVTFATTAGPGASIVATWNPAPFGPHGKTDRDKKTKVWRTRRSTNLGALESGGHLVPLPRPASSPPHSSPADVIVIEDEADRFRFSTPAELDALIPRSDGAPAAVVLKTSWPFGHGALWWHLTGSAPGGSNPLADRLVVIACVDELRRADARVSCGISWERTAEDLVREIAGNPALAELRRPRALIIKLGDEGALVMERPPGGDPVFTLIFDSKHLEDEWSRSAADGGGYGFTACLTAAVTAHVTRARDLSHETLCAGVSSGLLAMRALRLIGHGAVTTGANEPEFPASEVGELIGAADPLKAGAWSTTMDLAQFGRFGEASVPLKHSAVSGSVWRILEPRAHSVTGRTESVLYGKARRMAIFGAAELRDVPGVRFGKLFTVDRDEIESLRNLKQLMEGYAENTSETKPLSFAVFGPPGAGKSFGIKQIAKAVLPGNKLEPLEFNLSQFKGPDDLIGALHQVRDRVLEGDLPLVFWDEFDSRSYEWLQYLLAPMQDGKFQEGPITHPIGRCVFVFAGATTYRFENFPRADEDPRHFDLKKGPDFKSRLHGTLNVLGPNPRQLFDGGKWIDDPKDVFFPIRRAILLRSMLGLMKDATESRRLEMDPGLLGALLETRAYRFGSRSFEKIAGALRSDAGTYQRSALPPDEVLSMNVADLAAFKDIMDQPLAFQRQADVIAAAVHARWMTDADPQNAFRQAFEHLDAEQQADNRAAASRIPSILALAGLELVPESDPRSAAPGVPQMLDHCLERLAEEEHNGWMATRLMNGWKRIERTADPDARTEQRAAKRHDCLVPYQELPDNEKDKDRGSIRWYPELAKLAGFKIVAKG